jgi:hypothetical protein
VHDWLVDYAGSERVLTEILRCLPRRICSRSSTTCPKASVRRWWPSRARCHGRTGHRFAPWLVPAADADRHRQLT